MKLADWYWVVDNFARLTHAHRHAADGTDPITPESIGAASAEHTHDVLDGTLVTPESIGAPDNAQVSGSYHTLSGTPTFFGPGRDESIGTAVSKVSSWVTLLNAQLSRKADKNHATQHAADGTDPITPGGIGAPDNAQVSGTAQTNTPFSFGPGQYFSNGDITAFAYNDAYTANERLDALTPESINAFPGHGVTSAGHADDLTSPGTYRVSASALTPDNGYPEGLTAGYVTVQSGLNVAYVYQTLVESGGGIYVRTREAGTWRPWTRCVTEHDPLEEHTHDVLDVDGLEAELQDKADAADVHDTDWVLVPLEDGWTGTARVRRTGSLVHFNVTDLVGPDSTTIATFAVIPEGFRAGPGFTAHGVGATSSSTAVGAVAMTATSSGGGPDMSQNVRVSTPSSWRGGAGNVWWHTDEPMPSSQYLAAMRGDGERGGPITGTQIVARSARWFPPEHPDQVPYSRQDTYTDGDGHEYRADCSGFVSMCLHADRSYSTRSIEEISVPITKEELSPGDYLNSPDNHVVLFLGWTDETRTRYYARESSGPKGGTIERDVPYPYYSAVETYVPLRYVNRT